MSSGARRSRKNRNDGRGAQAPLFLLPSRSSQGRLLFNCRLTASVWQQGRCSPTCIERLATGRQIGAHIAPLLLTARDHRQDMGNKLTALLTLRAVAGLTPLDGMPQTPFRRVVGQFDALYPHEGPQGGLPRQQLSTGRRRLGTGTRTAVLQFCPERGPQGVDIRLQGGARPGAIAHPLPPSKEYLGM